MTAHDVAIIGYGPVGAILANQLGNDGFDVLVVEQMANVYDKPRAINIDHEVMRVLQSVGLAEAVDAITMPHTGTNFVGLNDRVIKRFAPIAPPYPLHWSPNLMFIQPEFEPLLRDGVARFSNVEVRLETAAKYVEQDANSVTLHLVGPDGKEEQRRARFLIACDGATSPTRKGLGITQESLDFDERWTVVDAWLKKPTALPAWTTQFCLPSGPTTYVVGPKNLRRWELKLLPHEAVDTYDDFEAVRRRLAPFVDPDAIEIWRVATYRFHALVAHEWRRGRIFLAGDAAHQMPPFMAQGLCSGVRDVANLGWKLSGVLRGAWPETILDTYEEERKPHIRHLTEMTKALGEIIGELDVDAARRRDARLGDDLDSGRSITVRQQLIPDITAGLIATGPDGRAASAAGTLFPQPIVRDERGSTGLLDNLIGERFALIFAGQSLCAWTHPALDRLDVARFVVSASDGGLIDETGVLTNWLARHNAKAVLVRPDKVVFGVARDIAELQNLVDSLPSMIFGAGAVPRAPSASQRPRRASDRPPNQQNKPINPASQESRQQEEAPCVKI
jgi:3-(3-hydroxy-phenyl)propionate hydroxylase